MQTCCDLFSWPYLKSKRCANTPNSTSELKNEIWLVIGETTKSFSLSMGDLYPTSFPLFNRIFFTVTFKEHTFPLTAKSNVGIPN